MKSENIMTVKMTDFETALNLKLKNQYFKEYIEDMRLLYIAKRRIKTSNPEDYIDFEEMLDRIGLTLEDLDNIEVDIE